MIIDHIATFREEWGVHPLTHLSRRLTHRLQNWIAVLNAPGGIDPDKRAHPKATAAVAIYDDVIDRLAGKTGARADAARDQISAARAPLAAALDLVNSLRTDYSGPFGIDLQKRIASTRAGLLAALAAKELATRSEIQSALLEIEQCWADVREVDRDLDATYERLRVPPLPDIDALRSAEALTRALEGQPATSPSAVQVHAAIEQALRAPAQVAMLFIAYETKPDHELVLWRAQTLAELQPAAAE